MAPYPPPPPPPPEEQFQSTQEGSHHIILDEDNDKMQADGPKPTRTPAPTSNDALVAAKEAVGAPVSGVLKNVHSAAAHAGQDLFKTAATLKVAFVKAYEVVKGKLNSTAASIRKPFAVGKIDDDLTVKLQEGAPASPDGTNSKFSKESRLPESCDGCAWKRGGVDNFDPGAVAIAAEQPEAIKLVAGNPAMLEVLKTHPGIVKAASEHPEVLEEFMKHHDVVNRILENPDVSELLMKSPSAIHGAAPASIEAQDEDHQLSKRDVEFATGLAAEQEMLTRPTVLSVAPFHGFRGNVQLVPRTIISDPTDNKCYTLFVVGGLAIAITILGIASIVNSCTFWKNRVQRASGASVEPYGQEKTKEETW